MEVLGSADWDGRSKGILTRREQENQSVDAASQELADPVPIGRDNLYLFEHGFIFTSSSIVPESTERYPGVLLLSEARTPIGLTIGDQYWRSSCLLVAPRVMRSLDARGVSLISVHVEPTHPMYKQFCEIGGDGVQVLDRDLFRHHDVPLRDCCRGRLTRSEAQKLFDALLLMLSTKLTAVRSRDPRMNEVFRSLQQSPSQSLEMLAKTLCLSRHRLSHLFSEEVGLPIMNYRLWQKIKSASRLFNSGKSLTEIAHAVGFSDSAHLSRTFRHFYGFPPSRLTDSTSVQVFD